MNKKPSINECFTDAWNIHGPHLIRVIPAAEAMLLASGYKVVKVGGIHIDSRKGRTSIKAVNWKIQ